LGTENAFIVAFFDRFSTSYRMWAFDRGVPDGAFDVNQPYGDGLSREVVPW